jgi:hypothetical protein
VQVVENAGVWRGEMGRRAAHRVSLAALSMLVSNGGDGPGARAGDGGNGHEKVRRFTKDLRLLACRIVASFRLLRFDAAR